MGSAGASFRKSDGKPLDVIDLGSNVGLEQSDQIGLG